MTLLRLISWQYFRKHKLRSVLTTAGIVLGVAVYVGIHTANQSVLYAFNQTVDRIAGATQLQVSAGETGFDEEVLERVQSLPGVRTAVPVIEAVVSTGLESQGNILILGVDMTGDRSLREYDFESGDEEIVDDPLIFLAQPDSIIITRPFAERNNLDINSRLSMSTMEGDKSFTVRGIMKSGGLNSAFGGNLAVMDIYAAQAVFGRGRKFDRIDLAVAEGATPEAVQAKLRAMLGPGFDVEPPSARGRQFESMARIYSTMANITSLFALFIGMFIIYNTFSIAVTQRRSEIGILRALGATRGQIRTLFLAESAMAGVIGAAAGLVFGIFIARAMAGYIGGLLGEVYGVAQRAEEISADPRLLAFAMAIGIATSIVAGWLPARSAAGVDPVHALQKGRYQLLTAGENRARRIAACVLLAGTVVSFAFASNSPIFYTGYFLAIVAALLLTPTLALWLARAIRPLLKAVRPVEGALAADSLIQAPRRTSGTVAALMLSLALVVGLSGVARASYNSILRWLNTALNPDLFVSTSESLTARSFRFPAEMGEELERIEGIRQIQRARSARIPFRGEPVMLVSIEIGKLSHTARLAPLEGNADEMYRLAEEGKGVVVSDNFSLLKNVHLGDVLELATPSGVVSLPVLGVVFDYSDQQGTILMDRKLYRRLWNDDTVNVFRVYLEPGSSAAEVKQRILERFGSHRRLFVLTNQQVRDYILRLTDQWFGLTYVQIAVAVLVAMLGIVNTLTVSITDRRRELGVLQAVGALRNQVRHTVWIEALCIGFIGLVLGLALGAGHLYYTLEISRRDLAGLRLDYDFPLSTAAALLPVILGSALLSALGPAESAVRGSLVEALEYE